MVSFVWGFWRVVWRVVSGGGSGERARFSLPDRQGMAPAALRLAS
jgi:hypothetical protein